MKQATPAATAVLLGQRLFDELNTMIRRWDPLGLYAQGELDGEFSDEVQAILWSLPSVRNEEDTVAVVQRVFAGSFSPQEFPLETCAGIGASIHRWWMDAQGSDRDAPAIGRVTLDALAAFPDLLEAHFAAFPLSSRHWAPPSWDGVPSEPLTAIEQVCHVRDIEIEGYHVRLRRTLVEADPLLASIDTEALARERNYGDADVAAVFASFRAARVQTIAIISALDDTRLARTARFEGYGPVTLRSLVHYLCSHDQQHLAGLQWLLGKLHGTT